MLLRLIAIITLVPLLGLGCRGTPANVVARTQPFELTWWRVFDDPSDFSDLVSNYRTAHPNVSITVKVFRPEEYEKELLNALAEDRGPDIFSIHNTWVRGYQPKILPMPASVEVPFATIKGFKKEVVFELKRVPLTTLRQLKDNFVSVVEDDAVIETKDPKTNVAKKQIYGLPLSLDVLAMYYNKDLLAQNKIATPPTDWAQFQTAVKTITRLDSQDNIIQSGAALGTTNNISRAPDMLSVLMMQNGSVLSTETGQVVFDKVPAAIHGGAHPGIGALRFYTNFARPTKEVYTWNEKQSDSLDTFSQGRVGFYLGYAYHLPIIKQKAPKLNFDIAPIPQLNPNAAVNIGSYWLETVSKRTKHPEEAWHFITYATSAEQVKSYIIKTKKPTALRALIKDQVEDLDLAAFAHDLLIAKSWYRGKDSGQMNKIMNEMIVEALQNAPLKEDEAFLNALERGANRLNQTL